MEFLDLDYILDSNRTRTPSMLDTTPENLTGEWWEVYVERAAIREFDGGMPRELAEHYALLDVLALMKP
jgi:hypothetical protein